MDAFAELLSAVAAYWRSQGVESGGGASAAEIDAFERDWGVRLPPEVRMYFATLNGMRDDAWDDEFIAFWNLARVRSVRAELEHQEEMPPDAAEWFCFADFSVWCNAYAVRLTPDCSAGAPVVAVYSGEDLIPVAGSFADFFKRYLSNERRTVLHPPWEKDGKHYGAAT